MLEAPKRELAHESIRPAQSGNLAKGQEKLSGAFLSDVSVVNMLDDVGEWPSGAGLHCIMNAGDVTQNQNRFQLAPFTNAAGEIGGLWTNILGLSFVLLLEPLDVSKNPQFARAVYRPGQIVVTYPKSTNWLVLSWDDGRRHNDSLSLRFVAPV